MSTTSGSRRVLSKEILSLLSRSHTLYILLLPVKFVIHNIDSCLGIVIIIDDNISLPFYFQTCGKDAGFSRTTELYC